MDEETPLRFQYYFDATPLPLLVVDSGGLVAEANPQVTELFGYGRDELIGVAMDSLIPESFGPEAWRRFAFTGAMKAQPSQLGFDLSLRRRDGVEVPIQIGLSVLPASAEGGGLEYLLAIVDISARKAIENRMASVEADLTRRTQELQEESGIRRRAESDLDRSREDFRYLFLRNPLPMLIYNPQTLRFLDVNEAAIAKYGYSREEFLSMTTGELHPPDYVDRANEVIDDARNKEYLALRNWKHRDKAGRVLEVDTYSRALGVGIHAIRLVAIVDVTERNQTEAQLRQAQKMEAVGQLTGGVAHDFNNLLTIILGNLEMIAQECAEQAHIREMVSDALASVNRGASLTQRLLAYARQQPLEPKLVDIQHLIDDMAGLLRRSLGETIQIQHYLAPDLWKTRVDPSQLENAILNLAVNARDAMPLGGKLTIEAQNALLDGEYAQAHAEVTAGEYVQIAVSDTGTGMPKEVLEHILEPFFTTKPVGRGTGLGLSMVYGFIKQSGGHLKVYSELGVGTTIKLYLPRAADEKADPGGLMVQGTMPRAQREEVVLLVEDDVTIRKLVERLLTMLGYRVLLAEDGPSALDVMGQAEGVDLLFTDVVLPGGMSGVALAAEAQLRHPALKVLYMSGYTRNALMHSHVHDENAHLLSKPFRKEELARAVHKALNG